MKDDEVFARDGDEFERVRSEDPPRKPRRTIVVVVVAGVAVLVAGAIAVAVAVGGSGASAGPEGGPGTSMSPSAADPDQSPSPSDPDDPEASTSSPTPSPDESDAPDGVDPGPRETLPPVDFEEPVTVEGGPSVSVGSIESVEGEAVLPGEVSGPAVRVTVRVGNESDEPIDLTTAAVTLYAGESGLQASPISKPAGTAFPAEVEPGESAEGAFVFELPEDQRSGVRVEVDLSVSDPLVAFEGDIG